MEYDTTALTARKGAEGRIEKPSPILLAFYMEIALSTNALHPLQTLTPLKASQKLAFLFLQDLVRPPPPILGTFPLGWSYKGTV